MGENLLKQTWAQPGCKVSHLKAPCSSPYTWFPIIATTIILNTNIKIHQIWPQKVEYVRTFETNSDITPHDILQFLG